MCENCINRYVCKYKEKTESLLAYINTNKENTILTIETKCKERRVENA